MNGREGLGKCKNEEWNVEKIEPMLNSVLNKEVVKQGGRRLVATLMGAEIVPGRGWQQGAMLLDWGFGLPTGASVGHLVTAAEVAQSESAPPPRPATAPGAAL